MNKTSYLTNKLMGFSPLLCRGNWITSEAVVKEESLGNIGLKARPSMGTVNRKKKEMHRKFSVFQKQKNTEKNIMNFFEIDNFMK